MATGFSTNYDTARRLSTLSGQLNKASGAGTTLYSSRTGGLTAKQTNELLQARYDALKNPASFDAQQKVRLMESSLAKRGITISDTGVRLQRQLTDETTSTSGMTGGIGGLSGLGGLGGSSGIGGLVTAGQATVPQVGDLQSYLSRAGIPSVDIQGFINQAVAGVESEFAGAEGRSRRELSRIGITPTSGRGRSEQQRVALQRALARAGARMEARKTAEAEQFKRDMLAREEALTLRGQDISQRAQTISQQSDIARLSLQSQELASSSAFKSQQLAMQEAELRNALGIPQVGAFAGGSSGMSLGNVSFGDFNRGVQ